MGEDVTGTIFSTVLNQLAAGVQQGSTQLVAINRGIGRVFKLRSPSIKERWGLEGELKLEAERGLEAERRTGSRERGLEAEREDWGSKGLQHSAHGDGLSPKLSTVNSTQSSLWNVLPGLLGLLIHLSLRFYPQLCYACTREFDVWCAHVPLFYRFCRSCTSWSTLQSRVGDRITSSVRRIINRTIPAVSG